MNRSGVGLIELMIGMLVLTVAVLALAGSTSFVAIQLQAAGLRTERHTARQQVFEELRTLPFDNVQSRAEGDAVTRGEYTVWWAVSDPAWALKEVEIYTQGPSVRGGERRAIVVDTVTFRIARLME